MFRWLCVAILGLLGMQPVLSNTVEESAYVAQELALLVLQSKLCPYVANDQKFLISLTSLMTKYVTVQDPVFMQEYARIMEAGKATLPSIPMPTGQQCSNWFAGAKQKLDELNRLYSK